MASNKRTFREQLIALTRWVKRGLVSGNDFAALSFALWAAYSLRLNTFYVPQDEIAWLLFLLAPTIGIITFYFRGLYRLVTRYF